MHISPAADDDVRAAPQEMQESVFIERTDIARICPASFEAAAPTCRALAIDAARHARRTYADGASFSVRKDFVVVIYDLQEHMRQHTAKAVGSCLEIGA